MAERLRAAADQLDRQDGLGADPRFFANANATFVPIWKWLHHVETHDTRRSLLVTNPSTRRDQQQAQDVTGYKYS
jgi:hypothetical protein